MSETKPLEWRLTDGLISWSYGTVDVIEKKAYDKLEAELAAINARLDQYEAVHTCSAHCKRPLCVVTRELAGLKKQIDDAPWVHSYGLDDDDVWQVARSYPTETHRAKLIGVEKL